MAAAKTGALIGSSTRIGAQLAGADPVTTGAVAGQLVVARFAAGRSRPALLAAAAALIGVGIGLPVLGGHLWIYVVGAILWSSGEMIAAPTNTAVVADLAAVGAEGRYQALYSLSLAAALVLAPLVGGSVGQHLGVSTLLVGCIALGLVVAAGNLLTRVGSPRTEEIRRPAAVTGAAGPHH